MAQCSSSSEKIKNKKKYIGTRSNLSLALVSCLLCDGCCCTEASRSTFPLNIRWRFWRENQTKIDKRNISPGVLTIENCDVCCLQQPSSLFWTLSVTSLETIWNCVGSVFVWAHLSFEGEYYICGGGLMRQACTLLFLCRQSPLRTVNDFSTSSRVIDNHKARVGCAPPLTPTEGRGEEKVPTSPCSCSAVHVFPFGR